MELKGRPRKGPPLLMLHGRGGELAPSIAQVEIVAPVAARIAHLPLDVGATVIPAESRLWILTALL